MIAAAPGLFTKDTQTPPKAQCVTRTALPKTRSSTPAKRGDIVSIYATGPGALNPQPADGTAPGANPVVMTRSTPQVYIGGVEATVQFSGLNPDAPGLWQINVTVPDKPFISGRVPVQVFMNGVDSNEVAVFVAQ